MMPFPPVAQKREAIFTGFPLFLCHLFFFARERGGILQRLR